MAGRARSLRPSGDVRATLQRLLEPLDQAGLHRAADADRVRRADRGEPSRRGRPDGGAPDRPDQQLQASKKGEFTSILRQSNGDITLVHDEKTEQQGLVGPGAGDDEARHPGVLQRPALRGAAVDQGSGSATARSNSTSKPRWPTASRPTPSTTSPKTSPRRRACRSTSAASDDAHHNHEQDRSGRDDHEPTPRTGD